MPLTTEVVTQAHISRLKQYTESLFRLRTDLGYISTYPYCYVVSTMFFTGHFFIKPYVSTLALLGSEVLWTKLICRSPSVKGRVGDWNTDHSLQIRGHLFESDIIQQYPH